MTPGRRGLAGAWLPPIAWCVLLFALSALPFRTGAETFRGADKAVHAAEYAVLGFLLARALLLTGPHRTRARNFALAAGLGAAYGLTDELHQLLVPERAFEWGDLAADALGAAAGAAVRVLAAGRDAASSAPAPAAPSPPSGSRPRP